jgi:hypothetical protein
MIRRLLLADRKTLTERVEQGWLNDRQICAEESSGAQPQIPSCINEYFSLGDRTSELPVRDFVVGDGLAGRSMQIPMWALASWYKFL